MGENCIYKNKRIVIWVGLFLCLLFGAFINAGTPSRAIDLNYEDFALLKIDGSKTVMEVENAKNFNSNTAPSYVINNYKYIEDNKLIFKMKFSFSCEGMAQDLNDNPLVNLFGENWQADIFNALIEDYDLKILVSDNDGERSYMASQETINIVNGYTQQDWQSIIAMAFPRKVDSVDNKILLSIIANMKATFMLMADENTYIKVSDLPSSSERLIYYCASSSDNETINFKNGEYSFNTYDPYATAFDDNNGFISSYVHLFSSYNLKITAKHNDNYYIDTNGDGITSSADATFISFMFPAYYDLNAILLDKDFEGFESLGSEYTVEAGNRTQALFCKNWQEGQLRLEEGDDRYYGYCDGGYSFVKNQGEFIWELSREIDLSSTIFGYEIDENGELVSYSYKFADGPHAMTLNFAMEQELVNLGFTVRENEDSQNLPSVTLNNMSSIIQDIPTSQINLTNEQLKAFAQVSMKNLLATVGSIINYQSITGNDENSYFNYIDSFHKLLSVANSASKSWGNKAATAAKEILSAVGVVLAATLIPALGSAVGPSGLIAGTVASGAILGSYIASKLDDPSDTMSGKLREIGYLLGTLDPDENVSDLNDWSNAPARVQSVLSVLFYALTNSIIQKCKSDSIDACLMTFNEFKSFIKKESSNVISVYENKEDYKQHINREKEGTLVHLVLGAAVLVDPTLVLNPVVATGALAAAIFGDLDEAIVEVWGSDVMDSIEAVIEVLRIMNSDDLALEILAAPVYQSYIEKILFGYENANAKVETSSENIINLLSNSAKDKLYYGLMEKGYIGVRDTLTAKQFEDWLTSKVENPLKCIPSEIKFKKENFTLSELIEDIFQEKFSIVNYSSWEDAFKDIFFNKCTIPHMVNDLGKENAPLQYMQYFEEYYDLYSNDIQWAKRKINGYTATQRYGISIVEDFSNLKALKMYSYFQIWVVGVYGTVYNPTLGTLEERPQFDLYNYFVMLLKSKFVNMSYTTTSKHINIIIDRTSPNDVVIDDDVSGNYNQTQEQVIQKDTQNYQIVYKEVEVIVDKTDVSNLYIYKNGRFITTTGKAVKNVKYYELERKMNYEKKEEITLAAGTSVEGLYISIDNGVTFMPAHGFAQVGMIYYKDADQPFGDVDKLDTINIQDKLIINSDYTFSLSSSEYGDANIKFSKTGTDRWVVGSGIDHFDYVIFKNIGKLGQLDDLELYGNVKYEKVAVTPNVTNLDLEELYILENGIYTLAKGTAADGQTYYKKVDLGKLWEPFSSFSTDIGSIVSSLTSIKNNLLYEQLWSQLSVDGTFTIEEDGQYIILVRAVDFVGNRGAVTVKEILIDTTAPEILLEFANKDKPIVATNEQYQDIANAIKNGEETTYDFVISDESISKMNISLVEETVDSAYASGLLVNGGKLTSFKMCISDIMNGGHDNCLNLSKQFYGYGVSQKGYISATSFDNQAKLETEWETGINSSSSVRGVYKPSFGQYVMTVDFGEDIATIYRVAFEISDVAGNVTLVRILVVSNIGNIEIESDISTKAEYDLTNPDNKIKDFDVTLLYSRFTIGDLTYTGENLSNEVGGNYLDLNDTKIMTYRYFVIGKSDRDKFYKLRDSATCDLDDNPNNPACGRDNDELSDRFLQVEPSNQLENLITSLTNLNEDHFIFQQFELKLGGTKKEYTYVIMQEFEYSLEDLMKQLSFTVNEYGHEVGSIVTDPTFELLSSEKFEFRLKFIDYSKYDKTGNADYGCIDEEKNVCYNLINKLKYTFDLYRLGISNPESSKHEIAMELDTYTDFVDFDEQSFDQTAFTTNSKRIVYKQNSNDEVDYIEYYIYINLLDYAEELKYSPTFSINNFVFVSTKNMKREHYDNNNQLIENLTSTYLLLNEEDTGFTIYTNYLEDNDDGNSKIDQLPNLGSFEFDPSMDVKEYDDNGKVTRWTNQSTLIFLLSDGSASFDYIFDPTLIYQYTVFPNNISEDYATALIADHYNIDLLNVLLVCQKPGDSLCTSAVTNQRLALINKYLETISRPDFNKLNRYLNNNNLSLVNVDMKILKELDIYTIEYQKIVAEYMYNLNDTVGIYNYLVNSSIEQTPLDRLKNSISSAVTTVEFWPTTYRIYSNMLGWNTVVLFSVSNSTVFQPSILEYIL